MEILPFFFLPPSEAALPLALRVVVFSLGIVNLAPDERWAVGESRGQFKEVVANMLMKHGRRAVIDVSTLGRQCGVNAIARVHADEICLGNA